MEAKVCADMLQGGGHPISTFSPKGGGRGGVEKGTELPSSAQTSTLVEVGLALILLNPAPTTPLG